ncbi:MAG: glycosyltransferase family 4 protein [candidate division WOR-3 bacterium]|nr:MAG: glycosyltransferase family 4 protein [candidate division WOR-3 bacterium]
MAKKNNLKILMVSDAYYPYLSGLSEYVHYLSCALRNLGHTVDIAAASFDRREDSKYPAIRIGRVVYIPLNKSYATVPYGFEIPAKMKYLINGSRYDVIHLNGPIFPNLSYFALKYSNARNVSTFHTSSERVKGFGSTLFKRVFEKLHAKIDVRIAVSRQAQRVNEMYVPGKYHIVPLGVDNARFTPDGERYSEMGGDSILFVGRMDPRKGLHRLLRAFVHVKREMDSAKLFVVGGGPRFPQYEKMVDDAGIRDSVFFRGVVPGSLLPKYFRSATVYTSPAEGGESFGLVLIEGMASGVPVIASRIAGYSEVVENGRNGILVDTADPRAYAEVLLRVLKSARLRRNLVSEGLRDVKSKYLWDIVGRRVEGFYLT